MNKDINEIKEQLLELYSQALDDILSNCPEDADFAEVEEQVERLAARTLPATLSTLVQRQELSPPVSAMRSAATKKR